MDKGCVNHANVNKWVDSFKSSRISVNPKLDFQSKVPVRWNGGLINLSVIFYYYNMFTKVDVLHKGNSWLDTLQLTGCNCEELGRRSFLIPRTVQTFSGLIVYLYGPLKDVVRGKRFANKEEVKVVQKCLRYQLKDFLALGIEKLKDKWDKLTSVMGDYVQKSPDLESNKLFVNYSPFFLYTLNDPCEYFKSTANYLKNISFL